MLGSLKEQSQSIKRSIDIAESYQNRNLEYSSGMLTALRNIEGGIGSLTGLIGRQLGVGGALDTSDLGLGTTAKKSLLGLAGKTTTTDLVDQGLQFNSATLGSIANGGLSGYTYQDISRNTTKKFLGITYSNKTTYSTEKQSLDAALAQQIALVIGSLKAGAVEAANALGVAGSDALLNSMVVNIGRISTKGLTADQIEDQLNAVFSKVGDQIATTLLPAVTMFQQAGEGAFETLVRVARQYQVVDVTLASMGKSFGAVGLSSLAARERLVNLVGGLEEFTSQAAFFTDNFLSEQDRLAPAQRAVTEEMKRLGLTGITTREQFKRLVMGLDVSTEGGAKMYAALMDLAPAFAAITDGAEKAQERLRQVFEFAQGLLTSNLSTLSPQQQLAIEQSEYQTLLSRARTGDVDALDKLKDASSEYLTAAQKFFAASPEYDRIFQQVYQELIALSGVEAEDPIVTALETEIQRLIDAINAGFDLVAGGGLPDMPEVTLGGGDRSVETPTKIPANDMPTLVDKIDKGLTGVQEQLARQTEAIVASNSEGFSSVVDATYEGPSKYGAYNGGMVRQSARAV